MIYTVTFNPAIDYIMYTDKIKDGKTNRSEHEEMYFGGKGINVSRVLSELGETSTALGFIGGFTGDAIEKFLKDKGIITDFVRLKNSNSRINVKLKGNYETEINAEGPTITEQDCERFFKKLDNLKKDDCLVLAGSVPKSLSSDIYQKIIEKVSGKDVCTVVDATGLLLVNTLKYRPFLIKPNRDELEEIEGYKLETVDDIVKAAQNLQNLGARNVLVSLGADGAILLSEDGEVLSEPAIKGRVINTVGSGDSMVAGFLTGLKNGKAYALKLGIAAGGATAFSGDLATKREILKLM